MPKPPSKPAPSDEPEADTPDRDGPPTVTPREARDIAKASIISTADIDRAGELWGKYAPEGFAGLWTAEPEGN